jgi:glycosyltransferase involved in cell wall biosynthesis
MNYKRIWIFSELYYPEDSATGHNITRVAEGVAQRFKVEVVCSQPTYLARGTKAKTTEIRHNVRIHRCFGTTLDKNILPFRLMNLLTISISIFLKAVISLRRDDIVLAVTNPPTLPFLVELACRLHGSGFLIRIEDVYPDAITAAGIARPRSMWIRLLHDLQLRLYRRASRIIVLGRDMQDLIRGRTSGGDTRVTFISNFADLEQIRPLQRRGNPLLKRLSLDAKFVVQYSGNMGRTHDIKSIVKAAEILHENPYIHFLFIGWGAKEPWLRETQEKLRLRNVTILPPQPRSDLCLSLNACDVALITFMRGMYGVSVPCRMYNNLAAGKPLIVVADPNAEVSRLVLEENLGWTVSPEMPARLAEAIVDASTHPDRMRAMALHARRTVEEQYSEEQVVSRYISLFRDLGVIEQGADREKNEHAI